MQELKIKAHEIIKINGKRFIASNVDDNTSITKLTTQTEELICRELLNSLQKLDFPIKVKKYQTNQNSELYFDIYNQDNTKTYPSFYLKNFVSIYNPKVYNLPERENTRYFINVANTSDFFEDDMDRVYLFTVVNGDIEDIKDITDDLIDGKFIQMSASNIDCTIQEDFID